MDIVPVISLTALGTAAGVAGAVVQPQKKIGNIVGGTLAGASLGMFFEGHPFWGVALAGAALYVVLSPSVDRSIGRLAGVREINPLPPGKKKYRVVHTITEDNDPRPVVTHYFWGSTPAEARHVWAAHRKSDAFLRDCEKLGIFDHRVKCKSSAYLERVA